MPYTILPKPTLPPGSPEAAALDNLVIAMQSANNVPKPLFMVRATQKRGYYTALKSAHENVQKALTKLETELPCQTTATPSSIAIRNYLKEARDHSITELRNSVESLNAANGSLTPTPGNSLEEVLALLSTDETNELARVLSSSSSPSAVNPNLTTLFSSPPFSTPPLSIGVHAWRNFASTHTIDCFHIGNATNVRVSPLPPIGAPTVILKLDFRFGDAPSAFDIVVHNELGTLLTPVIGPRLAEAVDPSAAFPCMRTLQCTTDCTLGSAKDYVSTKTVGSDERSARVSDVAGQMSRAFQEMESHNIYFPDAKISNWLVDGTGALKIADTKSLLRCVSSQTFAANAARPENRGLKPVGTSGFCSADVFNRTVTCPGDVHKALLGRNIYTALTGNQPPMYFGVDNGPVSLSASECLVRCGQEYKNLIEGLTHPDRTMRPTMVEAEDRLNEISILTSPVYQTSMTKLKTLSGALGLNPPQLEGLLKNIVMAGAKNRPFDCASVTTSIQTQVNDLKTLLTAIENQRTVLKTPQPSGVVIITDAELNTERDRLIGSVTNIADLVTNLQIHNNDLQAAQTELNTLTVELPALQTLTKKSTTVLLAESIRGQISSGCPMKDAIHNSGQLIQELRELKVKMDGVNKDVLSRSTLPDRIQKYLQHFFPTQVFLADKARKIDSPSTLQEFKMGVESHIHSLEWIRDSAPQKVGELIRQIRELSTKGSATKGLVDLFKNDLMGELNSGLSFEEAFNAAQLKFNDFLKSLEEAKQLRTDITNSGFPFDERMLDVFLDKIINESADLDALKNSLEEHKRVLTAINTNTFSPWTDLKNQLSALLDIMPGFNVGIHVQDVFKTIENSIQEHMKKGATIRAAMEGVSNKLQGVITSSQDLNTKIGKLLPVRELLIQIGQVNTLLALAGELANLDQKIDAFTDHIRELEELSLGPADTQMQDYIRDAKIQLVTLLQKGDFEGIFQENKAISQVVNDLKKGPYQEAKTKIESYNSGFASKLDPGRSTKADNLKRLLRNIPIDQRVNLAQAQSKEVTALFQEMARNSHTGKVPLNQEQQIITKKSASTFKDFKQKYQEEMKGRGDMDSSDDAKPSGHIP